jgi:hypothetical protein
MMQEEEQRRWEKPQLEKEANPRKKDNFTIKTVNLFRGKNDKIKLKKANSFSDHVRLYKLWINEQQKRKSI